MNYGISKVFFVGIAWFLLCIFSHAWADPSPSEKRIRWQSWNDSTFAEAKSGHKFVLLDLQAGWCHWCHVMDEKTYADPRVIELIQSHYIAVRVDQDSRPDLANRYQDYGWPATVVFNAEGSEIVKRQGYLPPEQMSSMLQAIIDDPTPGPSVSGETKAHLSSLPGLADIGQLQRQFRAGYDWKLGSWGTTQKFLNWDNVQSCLVRAQTGDVEAEKMARQTLIAQRQLIDPVWGGVDQYSAEGDWNHPHFEKLTQFQAENIRIYSEAYALWKEPADLQTAQTIYHYVRSFLTSPDAVVYTSQDADLVPGEHAGDYFKLNDVERRKRGIPRVDQHIYARENGWFIEALTGLYQATGDARYRDEAANAVAWIIKNRSIEGGGFRHGDENAGPVCLGDSLAMGQAFLGLYAITANHVWLDQAEQTAAFIDTHFIYKVQGSPLGFATAEGVSDSTLFEPKPDFDENVCLARFANLLFHYTGNSHDQKMAEIALHFAGSPAMANSQLSSVGGLILAESELASDPLHVTIVGSKNDPLAKELFDTAVAFPCVYKQVEWIDGHSSGSGANAISYPELSRSAAYTCTHGTCSSPVFDSAKLSELLKRRVSL